MQARIAFWSCLLLCAVTLPVLAEVNESGVKVPWSYVGSTGAQHWGMLSPAFELCDTGKTQSPINIGRKRTRAPYLLKINYHAAPLIEGENLTTELDLQNTQVVVDTGHSLQVNFHQNKETINYDGKEYELVQFHFHSPSETLWHKQAFPLEIHFVHQGKDGTAAVLAVLVKGGKENPALAKIIKHIPKESKREVTVKDTSIEPQLLLPDDKRYYAFQGSLTTPPCTEGLQWVVLSQPITASPAQILAIREASHGNNARPVQPLNDRALSYAVQ